MDTPTLLSQRLRALPARRVGLAAWLWGEAGIGKTQTAQELLRATPCRSVTLAAALPLPDLVRALPRPPRLRAWVHTALDRLQLGQTVAMPPAEVLAALLAGLTPFVLHLEDLHEADAARLDLTVGLAAAITKTRGTGLLVTSRRPAPHHWPPGALSIPLGRLDALKAAALLEQTVGASLPPDAVAWIFERACGNPLFTLEYFRLLARQGFLWNSAGRWRWRTPQQGLLPVTVEAVIEQLFQHTAMSDAAGQLVTALALSPPGVTDSHLVALTALPSAHLQLARSELSRLGILTGQGIRASGRLEEQEASSFVHPLYREIALKRVHAEQRQMLARRAVEVFRGEPEHMAALLETAQLAPAEALRLLWQAAEKVRTNQTGADQNSFLSARLLAQATAYACGDEQATLAFQAAHGLRTTDLAQAQRLAALAYQLWPGHSEAAWLYAELLADQGQLREAEACLETLPAGERQGRAWWSRLIELRGLARSHRSVLDLWQAHPEWQQPPQPQVMAAVAFAYTVAAQLEDAAQLAHAALTLPSVGAPTWCALTNVLGTVHFSRQQFEQAARAYAQATAQAHAAGLPQLEAMYLSNRAIALAQLGQFEAQLADLAASLRLFQQQGRQIQTARTQVMLADAHLDLAHYEQAEEGLLEARDVLARLGPSEHLIEGEYRLSVLYRHWAPPHGRLLSLKHGRAALEHARQMSLAGKLSWALCYASIAESCFGDAAVGRALAEEAATLTNQHSSAAATMASFAQGFALEAAGELAQAQATFEHTEAQLREQGSEDAAQEVGLEADRLAGRIDRAAQRLSWFEQAGIANLAQVTRRYFPALREGAVRPNSAKSVVGTSLRLRLDVLGEMQFGSPEAMQPVRGRKRRELLAYLLEAHLRGRAEVGRAELITFLYPQAQETQAITALKELVHQTRMALGAGSIRTAPGGYALGDLDSDAEAFLLRGEAALWRGPYLAGELDLPESLIAETLYVALARCAQALLAQQPNEAARLGRLLYQADPYDRSALTLTLQALREAGNHRSLSRFYQSARQELAEVGESLPLDWKLYLAMA